MSQSLENGSKDDRIFSIFGQKDLIFVWKVAKRNMVLQQCTRQLWMLQSFTKNFWHPEGILTQNDAEMKEQPIAWHTSGEKIKITTCVHRE